MTHTFDSNARTELKVQKKLFNPLEYNGKPVNEMTTIWEKYLGHQ